MRTHARLLNASRREAIECKLRITISPDLVHTKTEGKNIPLAF